MKKIRIMLSAVAILFAMGGALATKLDDAMIDGYILTDGVCTEVANICDTSGTFACKVNSTSATLHSKVSASQCGPELKRLTAPPAP